MQAQKLVRKARQRLIKMLSKLKVYALAALGALSALFAILFYRGKAKHEQAVREGIEKARETEKKAVNAMVDGLKEEQDAVDTIDNSKRDGFE